MTKNGHKVQQLNEALDRYAESVRRVAYAANERHVAASARSVEKEPTEEPTECPAAS